MMALTPRNKFTDFKKAGDCLIKIRGLISKPDNFYRILLDLAVIIKIGRIIIQVASEGTRWQDLLFQSHFRGEGHFNIKGDDQVRKTVLGNWLLSQKNPSSICLRKNLKFGSRGVFFSKVRFGIALQL